MFKFFTVFLYASAILILLLFDYANGSSVVHLLEKLCCRVVCSVVRTIKAGKFDFNFPVLLSEGTVLAVIVTILRNLKRTPAKDNIDDLLARSREAIKQTDDFLEKWRVRKINYQTSNDFSYFDEEPQKLQPFKLEMPILHMAIVDVTSERNQFERGDAADTIYISDTTIHNVSMTSLYDDNLSMLSDEKDTNFDEKETNFDERRLWDVSEEDNFDEF